MNLYHLPQHKSAPKIINGIVEIPKGTSAKYEYDNNYDLFKLDRCLSSAMVYPCSYGFISSTLADDYDPLDLLVYNATPIQTGTMVECEVIGVLDMEDEMVDGELVKDYKILGVPTSHIRDYKSLGDIDSLFLDISKNFFSHYKDLNNKEVEVFDWHEADVAHKIIKDSLIKS